MGDPGSVGRYLAVLKEQRRLSSHTLEAYRRDLARLPELPDGDAASFSRVSAIRRAVAQMHGSGLSGRSIARVLSAWRGYFSWLASRGEIESDPTLGIRPPKSPQRLPNALSPDESNRLLLPMSELSSDTPAALAAAVRDQAMFELFYSSGLRLAELTSLNMDCMVDVAQGEVRVLGKRAKMRIVPVGRMATAALQAWAAQRSVLALPEETALFVGARGARIAPRVVQQRLARHAQKIGLERHVHPHMLRHSFASHVLQSSGDLRAVQEMLGHASIASTQVYTHLDFQHLAKVYDMAHPRAKKK